MTGRVVHFEIPFDDERAERGNRLRGAGSLSPPHRHRDTMVTSGPTTDQGMPSEPGFVNGGMLQREGEAASGPVITVDVESIDAALEKVEKLGGSTVVGKQAVADMGFAAYFKDSEGNVMGLWENAPRA